MSWQDTQAYEVGARGAAAPSSYADIRFIPENSLKEQ